jgi:hypothetical protein
MKRLSSKRWAALLIYPLFTIPFIGLHTINYGDRRLAGCHGSTRFSGKSTRRCR